MFHFIFKSLCLFFSIFFFFPGKTISTDLNEENKGKKISKGRHNEGFSDDEVAAFFRDFDQSSQKRGKKEKALKRNKNIPTQVQIEEVWRDPKGKLMVLEKG